LPNCAHEVALETPFWDEVRRRLKAEKPAILYGPTAMTPIGVTGDGTAQSNF